jgi:hypothetical protein
LGLAKDRLTGPILCTIIWLASKRRAGASAKIALADRKITADIALAEKKLSARSSVGRVKAPDGIAEEVLADF